ncbi:MAG: TonB-dependent receptor [Asticcacaulis sp.]
MISRKTRRVYAGARGAFSLVMASTALVSGGIAVPAVVQAQSHTYDVPAGALTPALNQLARQGGLELIYDASLTQNRKTQGVHGSYSASEALSRLLAGTGLTYRINGNKVILEAAPQASSDTIQLGAIRVEGATAQTTGDASSDGRIGAEYNPYDTYSTPAAVYNVDRERIDRVPPVATGDIFKGVPGVSVGDTHNGQGFQPNIRGMSGMGRVKVIIDDTETVSSTYKGYAGTKETNYIDTDFLAGYSVQKGVVSEGGGAIGGAITMRTMDARDIIKAGDTWGLRTRLSYGDNAVDGSEVDGLCVGVTGTTTGCRHQYPMQVSHDRIKGISDQNYSQSAIGAWRPTDRIELVAGLSRRQSGNYEAGSNGINPLNDAAQNKLYSHVNPGDTLFGSYKNSRSYLLKGRFELTPTQTLSAIYNRFHSTYVERRTYAPSYYPGIGSEYPRADKVDQSRYSLSYTYRPEDNDWLNLKVDTWLADTFEHHAYHPVDVDTRTTGLRAANISGFDLWQVPFTLKTGLQLSRETTENSGGNTDALTDVTGGKQTLGAGWANLSASVLSWLTVNTGVRYDNYRLERDPNAPRGTNHSLLQKVNDDHVAYNFGLVLTPLENTQFFINYAEGFRAPSMRETFLGVLRAGENGLNPETSRNYEAGVNLDYKDLVRGGDRLGLKLTYFDNRYKNYIAGNGYFPGFFNLAGAKFRGAELAVNYDAGVVYGEYSHTRYFERASCGLMGGTECEEYYGDWMTGESIIYSINMPAKTSQNLMVGTRLFDRRLNLGLNANRVDGVTIVGRDASWQTTLTNSGYTVYDAFASFRLSEVIDLNLSVKNLTDRYYIEAQSSRQSTPPAPGRTIRLSLTSHFGGPQTDISESIHLGNFDGNWGGVYVSGLAGNLGMQTRGVTTGGSGTVAGVAASESAHADANGLQMGFGVGYNHHLTDNWVFGIEGDMTYATTKGSQFSHTTEDLYLAQNGQYQSRNDYRFNRFATLRGRLGYGFDRTLVYATGGLALVTETQSRTQYRSLVVRTFDAGDATSPWFTETKKATRSGWTLGGGAEYALSNNWSFKGEYLYADFGDKRFVFPEARSGVIQPYAAYSVTVTLRDPVTNAVLRDPITNAILRETTNYPAQAGTSTTVTGREARNDANLHSLRMALSYRF